MRLVEICVRRPVFATMMVMSLVVLGLFSYPRLGVDLYPNVEFPFVLIQTTLRGASPEEIETSVTKKIEEAVNTISGIEELNSTSYEGNSTVFIKFILDKNVDVAAQEVRDKVNGVIKDLPQGTDQPVIGKFDTGAIAVINVVLSGDRSIVDLTEMAKKKIKENIENVNGVGSVDIQGGREREIHVVINPLKLNSLGIPIKAVKDALSQQNVEVPGGKVENKDNVFVLRTLGRVARVQDFEDIVVATRNNTQIKISDIGHVEDTGAVMDTMSYLNGKPSVNLSVKKQSGSNTVEVVKTIKERMAVIEKILPPDVKTKLVGDQSTYINESVNTVKEHLVLGAILASIMVLVFMGDVRSTLIAATAIPASVIATFTGMQLAGFTLNNITLLGLTIAVGLVIDDAIVVLENVYRHMEEFKKPPIRAALDGTTEIGLAVMATTLSLLVIFLPMAYMGGIVGRFLKSYGLTIAIAVAVSLFIAFTLTPMLCSIFLKLKHTKGRMERFTDSVNNFMARYYISILEWAMAHRKTMVVTAIIIMLSTVPLLQGVGKDFFPMEDTSQFMVRIKAPEGTSLEMTRKICEQATMEIRRLPYIQDILATVGQSTRSVKDNEATINIELTPLEHRSVSMKAIMAATRKMFQKYTTLKVSVMPSGGLGGGDADLQYVVSGPELDKLQEYSKAIADGLEKEPGIADVDTTFSFAKPEYRVEIQRDRAHDIGAGVEDIANSLRTMVGGTEDITKYKDGDELYQVRLRAIETYRDRPEAIGAMVIPTKSGVTRLDSVAKIVPGFGPTQIDRLNRQRQVTVTANLPGMPLGTAISKADEIFKKLNASAEYKAGVIGKAKEMKTMLMGFLMAFLMAFLFIYMVLASQFESFVLPVSIMICLPLTLPFAVISLFLSRESLGMFSIMGMFMLFGVVKKNAILQVDYTNTLRREGFDRYKAIINANRTRLRPILMTTLTLVASMLPTVFGQGAGSGARRSMAWVIVCGQALSLLITLLMTPVAYSLMDDFQNWFIKKFNMKTSAERHEQLDT